MLFLGALLLSLLLNWFWPLPIFHRPTLRWLALISIIPGLALIIPGRRAFVTAGTNVNPYRPSTTIVRSGPYRFTRNPLYVGVTFIYLGLAIAFNNWWSPLLLVPVWLVMHFGVVLREERYLERKFGDNYRTYRAEVRRYL